MSNTIRVELFAGATFDPKTEVFSGFIARLVAMRDGIVRDLQAILRKHRDEIYDMLKDGTTLFVVGDGHTLDELARLGHPYSTSHGTIDTSSLGHIPDQIHAQPKGASIIDDIAPEDDDANITYRIILQNPDSFWYWRLLVEGSEKMLPRDIPLEIKNMFQHEVAKSVQDMVKHYASGGGNASANIS